jgi:glycosyltransferase involved in cell wall biosynthesis
MRVALIAPFVAAIDDQAAQIGGAQSVIADLARGLAGRGHTVTVIAPRGSRVAGATVVDLGVAADPRAALRPGAVGSPVAMAPVFRRVSDWLATADADVIHAHAFDAPAFAELRGGRVVHTLHLPPFDGGIVAAVRGSDATLATVSESCRTAWRAAGVPVTELLPNGIDVGRVPAGEGGGGYLAFAGRMSAEKGADVACRVARRLRMPLRLAGPRYDDEYFRSKVEPELGGDVSYEGALERGTLWHVLGGASATVLPIHWDEPFGMVALESIACGTPVAAYRRGGLAEVVTEGRSGCLVPPDDEDALARAIGIAQGLSRSLCRSDASRFDIARMLDAHETLYRRLVAAA